MNLFYMVIVLHCLFSVNEGFKTTQIVPTIDRQLLSLDDSLCIANELVNTTCIEDDDCTCSCSDSDWTWKWTCGPGSFINGTLGCVNCPAGSYSVKDASSCFYCAIGQYVDDNLGCLDCPPGFSCPSIQSQPIPCPLGSYSLGNSTDCTPCPPGFACPDTDRTDTVVECIAPQFSSGSQHTCSDCGEGKFCRTNQAQIPCPPGQVSFILPADRTTCRECIGLFYSPGNQAECSECSPPYLTNNDNTACNRCDVNAIKIGNTCSVCNGTTVPNEPQSACINCDQTLVIKADGSGCETCPFLQSPNEGQTDCTSFISTSIALTSGLGAFGVILGAIVLCRPNPQEPKPRRPLEDPRYFFLSFAGMGAQIKDAERVKEIIEKKIFGKFTAFHAQESDLNDLEKIIPQVDAACVGIVFMSHQYVDRKWTTAELLRMSENGTPFVFINCGTTDTEISAIGEKFKALSRLQDFNFKGSIIYVPLNDEQKLIRRIERIATEAAFKTWIPRFLDNKHISSADLIERDGSIEWLLQTNLMSPDLENEWRRIYTQYLLQRKNNNPPDNVLAHIINALTHDPYFVENHRDRQLRLISLLADQYARHKFPELTSKKSKSKVQKWMDLGDANRSNLLAEQLQKIQKGGRQDDTLKTPTSATTLVDTSSATSAKAAGSDV